MKKAFVVAAAVAVVAIAIFSIMKKPNDNRENIYIYTWADYIDPSLIQRFEQENNCNVIIDTFDSNEAMLAKLLAGAAGYDMITPTEYVMPLLLSSDLIDRIDIGKLPNVATNFDHMFESEWSLKWNVPYAFSCTGIMWRKDKVPVDLTFQDWNDMFDERLKGRICMMDDIREVIGLGLKMKGYSVNSTNKAEIAEATQLAKFWKSRCSKMDNESYRTGIPVGEFFAAMSYNSDAIMLYVEDKKNIGYSIPTNGTTASMDVMCVMKNARHKELAYKFMDMLYDMENAVKNSEFNGAPMPIVNLYENLSDEYKSIPFMRVSEEIKSRCENIQDVGEKLNLYSKAWDEIKSFHAN